MKIYLDMNDFASSGTVLSTLRSYDAINGNIEIFVKADGKVFTELDDFKKIRRRNKFDDDDLKYVNFFIKTLDDQDFRSLKSNNLLFRIHDDTILGCKKVYIFYNQNIDKDLLKNEIDQAISFYSQYIDSKIDKNNISVGIVEKFNYEKDNIYSFVRTNIPNFKEVIPLKSCIESKCNIVLLDDEVSFYIFTLLSNYSKFKKKEKSVKSYFSTFKPFSYHKIIENEVNLESLFTYSTFEIENNGKINLYLDKDIPASNLFSVLTFLQKLNQVNLE